MRVLAVNCNSSSLKFWLAETSAVSPGAEGQLAWGSVRKPGEARWRGKRRRHSSNG